MEASRPTLYEESGDFAMLLHQSLPQSYPEESHETVQVCIPYKGARYDVLRSSHCGSKLSHQLRAADILIIPDGQPHTVHWLQTAEILSLHFSNRFLERVLGLPVPRLRDSLVVYDPFIFQTATVLNRAVRENVASPTLLGSCAALIAHRVGQRSLTAETIARNAISPLAVRERARIKDYINSHLDRGIKVAELASLVGLSQWHFLRRFQVTEGTTPNRYISQQRIEKARELLMYSKSSVTQIAMAVGMSPSHFSRSFLRATGVSPQSFQRYRQT